MEFIDYRGGHVNVPAGRYKALCVNSDTESVLYRNTDSFDGFEAYAPEGVLNVGGSPAPRAEGTSGERIAGSPDRLYSDRLYDLVIEPSKESHGNPLSRTLRMPLPGYDYECVQSKIYFS